jgi:GNAT superfamily N-acetyltransferase
MLLFDAYRQFYKQVADLNGAKIFLSERINNNESAIFIATEGKDAVGFVQLYPIFSSVSMKRAWLLNDLFVATSARKKGVAALLLDAAKSHGRATDAKWLLLQTTQDNLPAQTLYEKNGWKKVQDCFYEFSL